jgi:hypothetical protein
MDKEDKEAKLLIVKAYFEDLEHKIAFLDELFANNRSDEALLLCCCYIEGIANRLYSQDKDGFKNFVRLLKEYGGEEILWHIHPKQLRNELKRVTENISNIDKKLDSKLETIEKVVHTEEEILDLIHVEDILNTRELEILKNNLWRGTFAAIAYCEVRCYAVHGLSSAFVSFSDTTFKGNTTPDIDFHLLHKSLQRIFTATKELSCKSVSFFGRQI